MWNGGSGGNGYGPGGYCSTSCDGCPENVPLPPSTPLKIPSVLEQDSPDWYIFSTVENKPVVINKTENALQVNYVPFTFGTPSGVEFNFNPFRKLNTPAESALFSYSVYFPADFSFSRGGKLPGFCIGVASDECATGARWSWSGGSVRLMFRPDGHTMGYVYRPLQVGAVNGSYYAAYNAQGPEYIRVSTSDGYTGDDLFCKADGGLTLYREQWNNITVIVAMSTPGLQDGIISITVNGATRTVKDVAWRSEPDVGISNVAFVSFFGGNDMSWAIDKPQSALFRNFSFAAPLNVSYLQGLPTR